MSKIETNSFSYYSLDQDESRAILMPRETDKDDITTLRAFPHKTKIFIKYLFHQTDFTHGFRIVASLVLVSLFIAGTFIRKSRGEDSDSLRRVFYTDFAITASLFLLATIKIVVAPRDVFYKVVFTWSTFWDIATFILCGPTPWVTRRYPSFTFLRFIPLAMDINSSYIKPYTNEAMASMIRGGLTIFTLIMVFAGSFYSTEVVIYRAQNLDWFSCTYFAVICLFTVGFGDIVPLTSLGRAVTLGFVVCFAGLLPLVVTSIAEALRSVTIYSTHVFAASKRPLTILYGVDDEEEIIRTAHNFIGQSMDLSIMSKPTQIITGLRYRYISSNVDRLLVIKDSHPTPNLKKSIRTYPLKNNLAIVVRNTFDLNFLPYAENTIIWALNPDREAETVKTVSIIRGLYDKSIIVSTNSSTLRNPLINAGSSMVFAKHELEAHYIFQSITVPGASVLLYTLSHPPLPPASRSNKGLKSFLSSQYLTLAAESAADLDSFSSFLDQVKRFLNSYLAGIECGLFSIPLQGDDQWVTDLGIAQSELSGLYSHDAFDYIIEAAESLKASNRLSQIDAVISTVIPVAVVHNDRVTNLKANIMLHSTDSILVIAHTKQSAIATVRHAGFLARHRHFENVQIFRPIPQISVYKENFDDLKTLFLIGALTDEFLKHFTKLVEMSNSRCVCLCSHSERSDFPLFTFIKGDPWDKQLIENILKDFEVSHIVLLPCRSKDDHYLAVSQQIPRGYPIFTYIVETSTLKTFLPPSIRDIGDSDIYSRLFPTTDMYSTILIPPFFNGHVIAQQAASPLTAVASHSVDIAKFVQQTINSSNLLSLSARSHNFVKKTFSEVMQILFEQGLIPLAVYRGNFLQDFRSEMINSPLSSYCVVCPDLDFVLDGSDSLICLKTR